MSIYNSVCAFVPFSLVRQTVQKIGRDAAETNLVAPVWILQNWYCAILEKFKDNPKI